MIPTKIIVHHTGGTDLQPLSDSSNYSVFDCDKDHKARFNFKSSLGWYVGYHYFIDKKGTINQCRADNEEGAHTIGQNKSSIGICLAGNFDATLPTNAQIEALKNLLSKKTKEWTIDNSQIFPHRKFASKTCYGKRLSDDWARNLLSTISNKIQVNMPSENAKIQEQISWMRRIIEGLLKLKK